MIPGLSCQNIIVQIASSLVDPALKKADDLSSPKDAQHTTFDNEDPSALVKGITEMVDEVPNKPWYHFKGDVIAQGLNLVSQQQDSEGYRLPYVA